MTTQESEETENGADVERIDVTIKVPTLGFTGGVAEQDGSKESEA